MSNLIGLEIRDRKNGTTEVETVELPVDFGKSPSGTNAVRFPAERDTISRQHGRLYREAGGLVYRDTSSNGSAVAGERIQDASRPVRAGDIILIEDFEIRIIPSQDLILKLTDQALAPLDELVAIPGMTCALYRTGTALALEPQAENKSAEGERQPVLHISFDGNRLTLTSPGGDTAPHVLINNRAVPLPAKVSSGDVVAMESHRLEVLARGQEKIVCGNPECRLLNDLPFEENCGWCGFYLAASGSFTRVTPP